MYLDNRDWVEGLKNWAHNCWSSLNIQEWAFLIQKCKCVLKFVGVFVLRMERIWEKDSIFRGEPFKDKRKPKVWHLYKEMKRKE